MNRVHARDEPFKKNSVLPFVSVTSVVALVSD
jgi:hypothetical protein